MKVTVFGASGHVGQQVTRLCLERGYEVVALVHSHNPFEPQSRLSVVAGDIYNQADVDRALDGSQAVISALGSWHTARKNVLESAMQHIIPAMEKHRIKRLITVTGAAALWSGDHPKLQHRLIRASLMLIAPKILRDGEAHLALLTASRLDWTCIRSAPMSKSRRAEYRLSNTLSLGLWPIPRRAVVTALVDQLEHQDFLRQAPVIHNQ